LGSSQSGQRKVGPTAKSFWLDAFNMSMAGKENLRHANRTDLKLAEARAESAAHEATARSLALTTTTG
jgi:hypothetical protein